MAVRAPRLARETSVRVPRLGAIVHGAVDRGPGDRSGGDVARVEVTSPVAPDVWCEIYEADRTATPSQSRAWLDFVTSQRRWRDASRLYRFVDGPRALVPIVVSRFGPSRLSAAGSFPSGLSFGGVVSPDQLGDEHQRAIWDDLTALPYFRLSIRPSPLDADRWRRTRPDGLEVVDRRAHVVDLDGGFDVVWNERVRTGTRSGARRAERLGVTVSSGSDRSHLEAYESLLLQSRDRWAGKQHEPLWLARFRAERRDPMSRIRAMVLSDVARLWIAWHGGQPAAGIIVLFGHNAHYTRGAMDRDRAARTRANDLLHRTAIQTACERGCRWYHMGESGDSASLSQFKERLGAQPYEYEEYLVERLPLHRMESGARELVKSAIGFRDA